MRARAYELFAIVAWPAAAWGATESAVRLASGATDGLASVMLLTACAAATIVASGWRRRALAAEPARIDR